MNPERREEHVLPFADRQPGTSETRRRPVRLQPLTGSIGVITINMPRIGYLAETEKSFMERLEKLMATAKESLEIKRKVLENLPMGTSIPTRDIISAASRSGSTNTGRIIFHDRPGRCERGLS